MFKNTVCTLSFLLFCIVAPLPAFAQATEPEGIREQQEIQVDERTAIEPRNAEARQKGVDSWCNPGKSNVVNINFTTEAPERPACLSVPGRQGEATDPFIKGLTNVSLNVSLGYSKDKYALDRDMIVRVFSGGLAKHLMPYIEPALGCKPRKVHVVDSEPVGNNLRSTPANGTIDDSLTVSVTVAFNEESTPPIATLVVQKYRWRSDCIAMIPQGTRSVNIPLNLPVAQIEKLLQGETDFFQPARMMNGTNMGISPMTRYLCDPAGDTVEWELFSLQEPDRKYGDLVLDDPAASPSQEKKGGLFIVNKEGAAKPVVHECKLKDRTVKIAFTSLQRMRISETAGDKTASFVLDTGAIWGMSGWQERNGDIARLKTNKAFAWESCTGKIDPANLNCAPLALDPDKEEGTKIEPISFTAKAILQPLYAKAESGDKKAQAEICRRYDARKMVELSYSIQSDRQNNQPDSLGNRPSEVIRWCRNAAANGDAIAQRNTGAYHEATKEYEEARLWYAKAAENGDVTAQYSLARLISDTSGQKLTTPPDHVSAAKWYCKAAGQGDKIAQGSLGYLYRKGEGVRQNYEEAYFWHSLAGSGYAPDAFHLTNEQVARVQKRVAEWKPTAAPCPR